MPKLKTNKAAAKRYKQTETEISKKAKSEHNSLNSFSKDDHSVRYEDSIIINLIEQLKKGDDHINSQE